MNICKIKLEEFESRIYLKYEELFPEEERRDLHNLKRTYESGIEEFYEVLDNDTSIGFILLEKLEGKPYYLDYFGIYKEYQNRGYGKSAIKEILKITKNSGLCGEIEKIGYGSNDDENNKRSRRLKFYKELGFEESNSLYNLYGVFYSPLIYQPINNKINKEELDSILFSYYNINQGKIEFKKNCKKIY